MSELIFVRHGQASFGKESYDKLSERGVEQIKILARHWQALDQDFDYIYSGSLLRQRETANELRSLVRGQPEQATVNPAFNEYNGDPLIQVYLRDHAAEEGFGSELKWPICEESLFQRLFEAATARWISNSLSPTMQDSDFEHWHDFQNRVYRAVDGLMEKHTGGSRVLVSTSGGVIAMALQRVLQFPDEQVIATNWMVHNSSVTRVKYGKGKVSMTQFNSLAHLETAEHKELVTFR
jgi:broad specificity phosphatase PhoE